MIAILQRINPRFLANYTSLIVLAFAGFNFLFFFFNRENDFTFPYLAIVGYSTISMLFGLLVYDIVHKRTRVFITVFGNRILQFLGRVSYACYIIHWPLYLIASPFVHRWLTPYTGLPLRDFLVSSVLTGLAYFLGYLSYRYFESRFLRFKKQFE